MPTKGRRPSRYVLPRAARGARSCRRARHLPSPIQRSLGALAHLFGDVMGRTAPRRYACSPWMLLPFVLFGRLCAAGGFVFFASLARNGRRFAPGMLPRKGGLTCGCARASRPAISWLSCGDLVLRAVPWHWRSHRSKAACGPRRRPAHSRSPTTLLEPRFLNEKIRPSTPGLHCCPSRGAGAIGAKQYPTEPSVGASCCTFPRGRNRPIIGRHRTLAQRAREALAGREAVYVGAERTSSGQPTAQRPSIAAAHPTRLGDQSPALADGYTFFAPPNTALNARGGPVLKKDTA